MNAAIQNKGKRWQQQNQINQLFHNIFYFSMNDEWPATGHSVWSFHVSRL